jgi:hypothetical protein
MDNSGTSPTLCLLLESGFGAAHAESLVLNPLKNAHPALRVSGPHFYKSP